MAHTPRQPAGRCIWRMIQDDHLDGRTATIPGVKQHPCMNRSKGHRQMVNPTRILGTRRGRPGRNLPASHIMQRIYACLSAMCGLLKTELDTSILVVRRKCSGRTKISRRNHQYLPHRNCVVQLVNLIQRLYRCAVAVGNTVQRIFRLHHVYGAGSSISRRGYGRSGYGRRGYGRRRFIT